MLSIQTWVTLSVGWLGEQRVLVVEPDARRGGREMLDVLRNTIVLAGCGVGQVEGVPESWAREL